MLEGVKERLLNEPEHIVNLLNEYDFHKIKLTSKEIRCAYEADSNPNSICIRLQNNEGLYVTDYGRNLSCDLIDYFIKTRNGSFRTVLQSIKAELGITNIEFEKPRPFFGGLWDRIKEHNEEPAAKIIPESILKEYKAYPNLRFLRDGIPYDVQIKYGLGYDVTTQRITIPIRNAVGDLIGVKGRCNYTPVENEPKYLYLTDYCSMSSTLFGYYQNYEYLLGNIVMVFESEKSVMQLDGMDYHQGVALGSNSLSVTQANLIDRLNPKAVVFMLDNNLPLENTRKNVDTLKRERAMSNYPILFFDWRGVDFIGEKDSPTDNGKEVFQRILKNHVKNEVELPQSEEKTPHSIVDAVMAAQYFVSKNDLEDTQN